MKSYEEVSKVGLIEKLESTEERLEKIIRAFRIAVDKLERYEVADALSWATQDIAELHAAALVSYYKKLLDGDA